MSFTGFCWTCICLVCEGVVFATCFFLMKIKYLYNKCVSYISLYTYVVSYCFIIVLHHIKNNSVRMIEALRLFNLNFLSKIIAIVFVLIYSFF